MPVYVVDADKNKKVVEQLGVRGFPTVLIVGTDRKMREYTGPRNGNSIAAFARRFI
jgi:thioredoxin-like negative regulator of GroEL